MLNQTEPKRAGSVPESRSDSDLAAGAARGDDHAFETIMRRHNRLLFRSARSILKSDAEAEDALQEAYVRAWRGLPAFRAEAKLSTWLVRIVMNEALGRLRHRNPGGTHHVAANAESQADTLLEEDPDRGPERMAMRAQMRRLMEARIDLLPEGYRSVFMLRAVEEMTVEEVADALDLPQATVRTRYFRARGILRDGLAKDVVVAIGDAFSFDGARCDRVVAAVLVRLATHAAALPEIPGIP